MSVSARIAYAAVGPLTAAYGAAARPLAHQLARRFEPPHRLHLGSGLVYLDGWVNVDWKPIPYSVLRRQPGPDLYADLARAIPFLDRSAAHVYANNFLEHLARGDARRCLFEAARVLGPGGRVRLVVPDAGAYARAYAEGDSAFFERSRDSSGHWPADLRTPMEYLATIIQGVPHLGWQHLWGYDFETLASYLDDAGFTDIERFEPNESPDPVLRDLDGDIVAVLVVEARQP